MAFNVKVGTRMVVDQVHSGQGKDGRDWQRVFIKSEDGKTKFDFFPEEIVPNLHEGDTVEVTDAVLEFKRRKKTEYEQNTEWLTFCKGKLKLKIVEGAGGFGGGSMPDGGFGEGGFGGKGFGAADFDPDQGELPF